MIPEKSKRVAEFENNAFGMFIHWGLYSQLGEGEWIWFLKKIDKEEYIKLIHTFDPKDFDADYIVNLAKKAGMKYITLTTRHHEGFSLYDTRGLSDFDITKTGCNRDLVLEFVEACRRGGIKPILYHTTLDWYKDSYKNDFDSYLEYLRKSVEILCTHYGEIGGFWFDGNWNKPDADWKLDEFYGTIRRFQPNAMIINNTGLDDRGTIIHEEVDSVTFEQGRPEPMNREGMKKYITSEMCHTINDDWGIGSLDLMNKSTGELIETLCACRKVGANYLLNVGPTATGEILKIQEATLGEIGKWIEVNGEAIYEPKPCGVKGYDKDFALQGENGDLYLFIHELSVFQKGATPRTFTGITKEIERVTWLDNNEELKFAHNRDCGLFCLMPTKYPHGSSLVVRVAKVEFRQD